MIAGIAGLRSGQFNRTMAAALPPGANHAQLMDYVNAQIRTFGPIQALGPNSSGEVLLVRTVLGTVDPSARPERPEGAEKPSEAEAEAEVTAIEYAVVNINAAPWIIESTKLIECFVRLKSVYANKNAQEKRLHHQLDLIFASYKKADNSFKRKAPAPPRPCDIIPVPGPRSSCDVMQRLTTDRIPLAVQPKQL